ncbi:MAG: hypothetical protein ACJ75B_13530 [Flavisolibacter sp.]
MRKKLILHLLFAFIQTIVLGQDLQRLALPKQQVILPARKGSTNISPVQSFCVDFNRYSKFDGTDDYTNVTIDALCVKFGNEQPITLQQALNEGKISMNVKFYDKIVFANLTNKPVEINIGDVIVLGKNKDDIENLLIPKGFAKTSQHPHGDQNQIWIIQSLINLGFLDEPHINNLSDIHTAKEAYFNSVWVQELSSGDFRNKWKSKTLSTKELSEEMKEHAKLLQYALACEYILPTERASIGLLQIKRIEPIWLYTRTLTLAQPFSKNWNPQYLIYKDTDGQMFFFDESLRLLKKTNDERELASALIKTRIKFHDIQIAGYGELNDKQGDAIAAAIELQLKINDVDSHIYYSDISAYLKNRESVEGLLEENASNKVKENISEKVIEESQGEYTAEVEFANKNSNGLETDVVIVVTGDKKSSVRNFIDWVNSKYKVYVPGSLYISLKKYCLMNKLKSYVKYMSSFFRMSDVELMDRFSQIVVLQKN